VDLDRVLRNSGLDLDRKTHFVRVRFLAPAFRPQPPGPAAWSLSYAPTACSLQFPAPGQAAIEGRGQGHRDPTAPPARKWRAAPRILARAPPGPLGQCARKKGRVVHLLRSGHRWPGLLVRVWVSSAIHRQETRRRFLWGDKTGPQRLASNHCPKSNQARNQLGTSVGGRKFCESGPYFFNYVQNIFPGGAKHSAGGGFSPPPSLVTGLRATVYRLYWKSFGCFSGASNKNGSVLSSRLPCKALCK